MKNFNSNTDNCDVWLTPPYIIEALGKFDLDPCAPLNRPWDTARKHYTIEEDGLKQEWFGRVWCNPPYGKNTFIWLEKLAAHGKGMTLIFARTETKGFHKTIWNKADGIFFFQGRLRFYTGDGVQGGSANAPSCLVSYGKMDTEILKNCSLKGKFILLNQELKI